MKLNRLLLKIAGIVVVMVVRLWMRTIRCKVVLYDPTVDPARTDAPLEEVAAPLGGIRALPPVAAEQASDDDVVAKAAPNLLGLPDPREMAPLGRLLVGDRRRRKYGTGQDGTGERGRQDYECAEAVGHFGFS